MQRDDYLFNGLLCLQLIKVLIVYYLQMPHSPGGEAFGIYALGTHNFSYKQEGIKEFERILTHNKKIVGFQIPNIIYDTFEFSSHLVDEK